MELKEYETKAMSTLMPSSDNFTYMSTGIMAEVGEFFDVVAKAKRNETINIINDQLMFSSDATVDERTMVADKLKKELGDVLWFVAGLARVVGSSLEEIAEANNKKLADRKERGVINGSGDYR